jgi:hypothetical protein
VFNAQDLDKYQEVWSHYDMKATGFIEIEKLQELLFKLGSPMGWDESYKDNVERQKMYLEVLTDSMKTYFDKKKFNFADLLDNIILVYVITRELDNAMED